jgi:uncharacterized membrane protein
VTSSGLAVAAVLGLYSIALFLTTLAVLQPVWLSAWLSRIIGMAALLGLVSSTAYGILYEIPTYGTDVIAFAHAGADLLLDGTNPYSATQADVRGILEDLALREGLATELLSGQPVAGVTYYPALHVLTFAATLALGVGDLRWAILVVEVVTLIAIWLATPEKLRFAIPVVLLVEPYLFVTFTAGGVTDWLWVLPLVLASASLYGERYGLAGLWVGLACAVKQQPWFAVPFLLIWVVQTSMRKGDNAPHAARTNAMVFGGATIVGFILPNLPFALWAPGDWLNGVLGPVLLDLVPSGQGLVVLVTQGYLGLSRTSFAILTPLVILALCVVYFWRFDRLRNLLWIFPPIVLFFSYRSLHNYFVFWLPLVALWVALEYSGAKRVVG